MLVRSGVWSKSFFKVLIRMTLVSKVSGIMDLLSHPGHFPKGEKGQAYGRAPFIPIKLIIRGGVKLIGRFGVDRILRNSYGFYQVSSDLSVEGGSGQCWFAVRRYMSGFQRAPYDFVSS